MTEETKDAQAMESIVGKHFPLSPPLRELAILGHDRLLVIAQRIREADQAGSSARAAYRTELERQGDKLVAFMEHEHGWVGKGFRYAMHADPQGRPLELEVLAPEPPKVLADKLEAPTIPLPTVPEETGCADEAPAPVERKARKGRRGKAARS